MPLSSAPARPQPRATTGIAGLDNVLGGGLPRGHLYLVEGSPGAGKTTLGLQFLLEGRNRGESGLYITLSETRTELALVADSHGWALDGLEIFELVSEEGLSPDAEQSILYPSEVELGETTRAVMDTVRRQKPDLEAEQRAGRALLWDKAIDRDAQAEIDAGTVSQQPYVYQTKG